MTNPVGRPKSKGIQSGKMLFRAMFIQEAFIRHRQAGAKYEFAIEYARDEWLAQLPKSRVSITTVKRILAETMGEQVETILVASKPEQKTYDEHGGEIILTVKEGERPSFVHPSIRARQ
jgi:hypothetical protein